MDTIGYHPDRVSEELDRRHGVLAIIALVASCILHALIIYYMCDYRFTVQAPLPVRRLEEPERTGPMKLLDVQKEPVELETPRTAAARPDDFSQMAAQDVSREAELRAKPPDKVAIQPPPVTESKLAGERESLAKPVAPPRRSAWDERQEIIQVEKKMATDSVGKFARREIPKVERVGAAPDVAAPIDGGKIKAAGIPSVRSEEGAEPPRADITLKVLGGEVSEDADVLMGEGGGGGGGGGVPGGLLEPVSTNAAPVEAIENFLVAEIYVYRPTFELSHEYFRIEIKRIGPDVLPVIPKDVVLVQDSSASMAEQRLHFCRDGMVACLSEIGPNDRLNIVRFREKSETCFPDWAENKPENLEIARKFISGMESVGNTDILESTKDLLALKRAPGRPIVALIVTDGRSTTGITDSSDIIGEFSKVNDGAISVFTLGTVQTANSYLLDLLSYCNRGDAIVVTSGRWDIPAVMQNFARQFSRPVMADIRFRFASEVGREVYPGLTSNLYLDRPLVLFGRQARGAKRVVFQAVGKAGEKNRDMVFDLELDKVAKPGEKDIREFWAKQRIYHLIGQYARKQDAAILQEIGETARDYKLKIPYKGKF